MKRSPIRDLRAIGLAALILLFILAGLACHVSAGDGQCSACERAQLEASSPNVTEIEGLNDSISDIEYPVMRLPLEVMLKEQKADKKLSKTKVPEDMRAIPPGSYSLLNQLDYVPEERNQGRCGDCWVWASTGVLELDLAYRKEIFDRLSIQYLHSNYQDGLGPDWACCGGFPTWFASFYTQTGKAIPWSNANAGFYDVYRKCEDGSTSMPASSIATSPSYSLVSVTPLLINTHFDDDEKYVTNEEAIANIKAVLRSNRGVYFSFRLDDWRPFFRFWGTQPQDTVWTLSPGPSYLEGAYYGGHGVLCVGYDDTDPNNRYWIMLNSWGAPSNRPDALFRVNMDMDYSYVYEEGLKAFGWHTFEVLYSCNAPQTPSQPAGPRTGILGVPRSYRTTALDPDGEKLKYTFDWGDGTTTKTDFLDSGVEAKAGHAWSAAGTYEVRAMATDSQGGSSDYSPSKRVEILASRPPYSPIRPYGPTKGLAGRYYRYSTSARDPDGDLLRYAFDWGDGSTTTTSLMPSGTRASASHAWVDRGTYQIRVKAVDSKGESSGWTGALVVIV